MGACRREESHQGGFSLDCLNRGRRQRCLQGSPSVHTGRRAPQRPYRGCCSSRQKWYFWPSCRDLQHLPDSASRKARRHTVLAQWLCPGTWCSWSWIQALGFSPQSAQNGPLPQGPSGPPAWPAPLAVTLACSSLHQWPGLLAHSALSSRVLQKGMAGQSVGLEASIPTPLPTSHKGRQL